jgi:F-type H+-transporting ATPase subunit a
MFSPLEHFELLTYKYIICPKCNVYFVITNSSIQIFFYIILVTVIFSYLLKNFTIIPKSNGQILIEQSFIFLSNLIKNNLSANMTKFNLILLTFISTLFFFNVQGCSPYNLTITAHVSSMLAISIMFFFGINFIGILLHKEKMYTIFLPLGTPNLLAPFLILIELISYNSRLFSLGIRIFANLLSGHTLLTLLSSFSFYFFKIFNITSLIINLLLLFVIFLILLLELVILFLQVYVFTVLICIYFKDTLYLTH